MASREERRLMRQRGAGAREIKNLEFNIILPGVNAQLKPQRSGRSRKTPQPELITQHSSRRTPASKHLKPQSSSRKTPGAATGKKRGRPSKNNVLAEGDVNAVSNSYPTQSDGERTVTKKRKIGGDSISKAQDPPRSSKPSKGRPQGIVKSQGVLAQIEGDLLENAPAEVLQKKRKKRKSIGQNSTRKRAKLVPTAAEQDSILVPIDVAASTEDLEPLAQDEGVESPGKQLVRELGSRTEVPDSAGHDVHQPTEVEGVEGITEPIQSIEGPMDTGATEEDPVLPTAMQLTKRKKRKKRKSIGQIQKPRRKSTGSTPIPAKGSPRTRYSTSKVKATVASSQAKAKRTKLLSKPETAEQETIDADSANESLERPNVPTRKKGRPPKHLPAVNEESPPLPHKATKNPRKPKPPSLPPAKQPKSTSKPRNPKPPPKKSIPITVYRLSRPLPSSTIILPTSTPASLKNPNPVDILSQFCRELLSKPFSATKNTSPSALESKRTQRTVEIYAQELTSRFLDLTQTLDMNTLLAARARLGTKQERGLKKDLAALKGEIRSVQQRKRELNERREKARKEEELTSLLTGISEAVRRGKQRGWNEQEPSTGGFELRLRDVAGRVSSWEGGGVLEKIRGVSGTLEGLLSSGL